MDTLSITFTGLDKLLENSGEFSIPQQEIIKEFQSYILFFNEEIENLKENINEMQDGVEVLKTTNDIHFTQLNLLKEKLEEKTCFLYIFLQQFLSYIFSFFIQQRK